MLDPAKDYPSPPQEDSKIINQESDVKLILNKGSNELESTLISVQWLLSKKAINHQPLPMWIVIYCYQNEKGERMNIISKQVFKITDRIGYIQIPNPGVYYLKADILYSISSDLLTLEDLKKGLYTSCSPEFIELPVLMSLRVPKSLFVEKPKSWLGKLAWKWVNLWYEKDPVDQCQYRKRALCAYTLQPILMLIGILFCFLGRCLYILYRFLVALFLSVWFIIARGTVLFFGWRPAPLFEGFSDVWNFRVPSGEIDERIIYGYKYRVWNSWGTNDRTEWTDSHYKKKIIRVVPFHIVLALAVLYGEIKLVSFLNSQIDTSIWGPVALSTIIFIGLVFFVITIRSRSKHQKSTICKFESKQFNSKSDVPKLNSRSIKYAKWLQGLSAEKPDSQTLPISFRNQVMAELRIRFYETKKKICKVYR